MTPMQRAEQIIEELCDDPRVWATHGCPAYEKMTLIKHKIAEAITAAQIEVGHQQNR